MVSERAFIGGSGVGLVLSGGGMRGAYEVGVIAGITEALGVGARTNAPFEIFAGTSVGAINAAYCASNAHRGDMAVGELIEIWRGLRVQSHLRLHPWGLVPSLRRSRNTGGDEYLGKSLLDPRPLELLVRRAVGWERLHANVASGMVSALIIATLDVASGRTVLFTELAPDSPFRPSPDPRRVASFGPVDADHVLASAAIPMLFPARRVGNAYHCDGGLRFNTPIAPAIRAGADRLVIVSTRSPLRPTEHHGVEQYPSLAFLAGKILNALLLDPMDYDLQVLARTNGLVEVLEKALSADSLAAVQRKLIETRGAPYRKLKALVFAPSQDIGQIAATHLRDHLDAWELGRLPRWFLGKAAQERATWEADWATYLLFDGAFGEKLVDLGLADARARADEIRDFFSRATRRFSRAPPAPARAE